MFVVPDTIIKILHNVPLNNDYDNTIYFENLADQTSYFSNKTRYNLNNQSYQRKERGWLKVEIPQNSLWDCSYLMYQNRAYGSKWFYAFILSVEYINDNNSLINYEIDVMQTWMFDYQLEPCFVEREHATTDELFENTIPENIEMGTDYNVQTMSFYNLDPTRLYMIISGRTDPNDGSFDPVVPYKMGNYFEGLRYISFDLKELTDLAELKNTLLEYIENGYENAIVKICQYPRFMGDISAETSDKLAEHSYKFHINLINVDGYIPKNKKLFCYPYNFVTVENSLGDSAIYKNELWNTGSLSGIGNFNIIGSALGVPQTMCYPQNYRDLTEDYQSGLSLTISIECAWLGDAFQVWLARNQKNIQMERTLAGIGIGVGALGAIGGSIIPGGLGRTIGRTGSNLVTGGVGSLLGSIKNEIAVKNTLEATPREVHGHINNDALNLQGELFGYRFTQNTIKAEYARIIDEYFSRFGYACNRIKIPNRNARQNWTYTKTIGCEILASMPTDDALKIKQIYDHGITFWNNPANLGNFGDFTNPVYST